MLEQSFLGLIDDGLGVAHGEAKLLRQRLKADAVYQAAFQDGPVAFRVNPLVDEGRDFGV